MANRNFLSVIDGSIDENIAMARKMKSLEKIIARIAQIIIGAYKRDKKVLVCGNGGSAADAQHLATELVCRFEKNRRPLRCLALTTNSSLLTATANDFGFEEVFSRQVKAWGQKGDVLIAISTSGSSSNVLKAAITARKLGLKVVGLTGKDGGKLAGMCDISLKIPGTATARIQEGHILALHILCKLVEEYFFA